MTHNGTRIYINEYTQIRVHYDTYVKNFRNEGVGLLWVRPLQFLPKRLDLDEDSFKVDRRRGDAASLRHRAKVVQVHSLGDPLHSLEQGNVEPTCGSTGKPSVVQLCPVMIGGAQVTFGQTKPEIEYYSFVWRKLVLNKNSLLDK